MLVRIYNVLNSENKVIKQFMTGTTVSIEQGYELASKKVKYCYGGYTCLVKLKYKGIEDR
jgi:hypothetical protein